MITQIHYSQIALMTKKSNQNRALALLLTSVKLSRLSDGHITSKKFAPITLHPVFPIVAKIINT